MAKQMELRFSKEQYEQRCSAIEQLNVPGWSQRKTRVVRKFVRDIFKAKQSSFDGTWTVRQNWLAEEFFMVSRSTLQNWLNWAGEAGLIVWSIDADDFGKKRTTIEINWAQIGVCNEDHSVRKPEKSIVKLLEGIGLRLAEKLGFEFRTKRVDEVELAIETWKANKRDFNITDGPEAVVFFLRWGKWPNEIYRSLEEMEAIKKNRELKRIELRSNFRKEQDVDDSNKSVDQWWDSLSELDRQSAIANARQEYPILKMNSPLLPGLCFDLANHSNEKKESRADCRAGVGAEKNQLRHSVW